jgi:hypothetical protein
MGELFWAIMTGVREGRVGASRGIFVAEVGFAACGAAGRAGFGSGAGSKETGIFSFNKAVWRGNLGHVRNTRAWHIKERMKKRVRVLLKEATKDIVSHCNMTLQRDQRLA